MNERVSIEDRGREALDKLVRPWSDVLSPKETGRNSYTPIDYPPMLDMLKSAVSNSVGTSGRASSSGSTMSILNLQALQLQEHVDGTVRAWWGDLSKRPCPKDLKTALTELAGMLVAAHASNQIRTDLYTHIMQMFPRWVAKIWEIYDPYNPVELNGSCPNPDCGAETFTDDEGSVSPALTAYYRKGAKPFARCQCCGWEWSEPEELVILGRHLGATQDIQFLEAVGVA